MEAAIVADRVIAESESGWDRLDHAAVGIVYGAILVLSVPFQTAVVLFGSKLSVALAKAFAELQARALETRERMTREAWRRANAVASGLYTSSSQ
jgi:hypothetical protein